MIHNIIDLFLHLDVYLNEMIKNYGLFTYGLLFIIIFCETGFVITPFLPGDSLLFAAGSFCVQGPLNLSFLVILLASAAILGNLLNFIIGVKLGHHLSQQQRFNLKDNIERTKLFFKKHGGKAIIISRFIPIIRTFTPFVAGMGHMSFRRFFIFNMIGGFSWVLLCLLGGYFLGDIPYLKSHFSVMVLLIIGVSLLPPLVLKLTNIKEM